MRRCVLDPVLRRRDSCEQRVAERISELSDSERRRLIEERLPTFTNENRYLLEQPSWSEERKREWVEKRILREYGRESEVGRFDTQHRAAILFSRS